LFKYHKFFNYIFEYFLTFYYKCIKNPNQFFLHIYKHNKKTFIWWLLPFVLCYYQKKILNSNHCNNVFDRTCINLVGPFLYLLFVKILFYMDYKIDLVLYSLSVIQLCNWILIWSTLLERLFFVVCFFLTSIVCCLLYLHHQLYLINVSASALLISQIWI